MKLAAFKSYSTIEMLMSIIPFLPNHACKNIKIKIVHIIMNTFMIHAKKSENSIEFKKIETINKSIIKGLMRNPSLNIEISLVKYKVKLEIYSLHSGKQY